MGGKRYDWLNFDPRCDWPTERTTLLYGRTTSRGRSYDCFIPSHDCFRQSHDYFLSRTTFFITNRDRSGSVVGSRTTGAKIGRASTHDRSCDHPRPVVRSVVDSRASWEVVREQLFSIAIVEPPHDPVLSYDHPRLIARSPTIGRTITHDRSCDQSHDRSCKKIGRVTPA